MRFGKGGDFRRIRDNKVNYHVELFSGNKTKEQHQINLDGVGSGEDEPGDDESAEESGLELDDDDDDDNELLVAFMKDEVERAKQRYGKENAALIADVVSKENRIQ